MKWFKDPWEEEYEELLYEEEEEDEDPLSIYCDIPIPYKYPNALATRDQL